jgi:hypothetical protein
MTESKPSKESRIPLSRRSLALIGGLGGAAFLGIGILIGDAVTSSVPTKTPLAVGQVRCGNNQPVEGVWVDSGSGSGWASTVPPSNVSTSVSFNRSIEQDTYTVHVGCNGSPSRWAISDFSNTEAIADTPVGFVCDPAPVKTAEVNTHITGICRQVILTAIH